MSERSAPQQTRDNAVRRTSASTPLYRLESRTNLSATSCTRARSSSVFEKVLADGCTEPFFLRLLAESVAAPSEYHAHTRDHALSRTRPFSKPFDSLRPTGKIFGGCIFSKPMLVRYSR